MFEPGEESRTIGGQRWRVQVADQFAVPATRARPGYPLADRRPDGVDVGGGPQFETVDPGGGVELLQALVTEARDAPTPGETGFQLVEKTLLQTGVTVRNDDLSTGRPVPRVHERAGAFGERPGLLRPEPGQPRGLGDLAAQAEQPRLLQLGDLSSRLRDVADQGCERRSAERVDGGQHDTPLFKIREFVPEAVEGTVLRDEIPGGRDCREIRKHTAGGSRVGRIRRARKVHQVGEFGGTQWWTLINRKPVRDAAPLRLVAGEPGADLCGLRRPLGERKLRGLVAE